MLEGKKSPNVIVSTTQAVVPVDSHLVKMLGVMEAFILCYIQERINGTKRREIPLMITTVSEETGISEYIQRRMLKKLQQMGLLTVSFKGRVPRKRQISLGFKSLDELKENLTHNDMMKSANDDQRQVEKK